MKKSFALCEVFSLTPCPLSAERVPSTLPTVAERGKGVGAGDGRQDFRGRKVIPFRVALPWT